MTRPQTERWTLTEYGQEVARTMPEEELLAHILKVARAAGWYAYHTRDSRGSQEGWPDVVLCKDQRLIIAELKSARGTVTPAQARWLEALRQTGKVETYVWRPQDLPAILDTLTGTQRS